MITIPTISVDSKIQEACALMVKEGKSLVAVLSSEGKLAGVITAWDITRAIAEGVYDEELEKIMSSEVISASPSDNIIDIIRDLEQNKISAMPVVEDGFVLGMVNSDLLAQRYLLPLLQS